MFCGWNRTIFCLLFGHKTQSNKISNKSEFSLRRITFSRFLVLFLSRYKIAQRADLLMIISGFRIFLGVQMFSICSFWDTGCTRNNLPKRNLYISIIWWPNKPIFFLMVEKTPKFLFLYYQLINILEIYQYLFRYGISLFFYVLLPLVNDKK
jgi:hypothetical protein